MASRCLYQGNFRNASDVLRCYEFFENKKMRSDFKQLDKNGFIFEGR